ncbi:hypothetical protein BC835DRAFT_1085193 [Cytidiella melzeri]|nr:hypothetical protein BC835DRAFT_1085193 [Cytidiella melzeri]
MPLQDDVFEGYSQQITKDSSRDLEILIDVDALQADDELLGTTILESIGQFHRPQLASLGDFLKRVLNHRCQLVRKVGAENLSWPVNSDLQSLTDRGKKAMRDIIARYVCIDDMPVSAKLATEINVDKTVFSRLDREVSGPFDQICAFLMSPNLRPLSPACAQLLKERLRSNPVQPFAALIQQWHLRSEGQTRGCQREVLDTLRYLHGDLSFDFERTFKHFCTVMGVYHSYLRPESAQLGDQYGWIEVLSPDDIATTGAFLCDIITSELHQNGVTRIEHSHSIFRAASCAFYLKKYLLSRNAAPYAMHQEMSALLAVAFVAPNQVAARTIIDACVQQNEQFYIQALCPVLADTRGRLGESGLQLALSNFHALITKNFLPNTRGLSKYLKLCFIAICLAPPGPSNSGAASNGLQWTKLFTSFATIISESSRETDAASRRLLTEIGGSLSRA